jgi:hypothetical protein
MRREHARHSPDECIDCGVCEPDARLADRPDTGPASKMAEGDAECAAKFNITARRNRLPTPRGTKALMPIEKFFSPSRAKALIRRIQVDNNICCAGPKGAPKAVECGGNRKLFTVEAVNH